MTNWNEFGADTGRFTLHEDGQITWQANKTNPLPGDSVAIIRKGADVLTPEVDLVVADGEDDARKKQLKTVVEEWLNAHLRQVLAPIYNLKIEGETPLEGNARPIADKLYENMGVIHRSEIESLVPELTPEHRVGVRRKKIKMGPILVFMPELVKPAGINLRALLWGLWNDRDLPMPRPADGRVSVKIDPKNIDRNFYRSIGYPIFGNLCLRIDMLDRVVTDVYDSSSEGKFQAQHKYMEWLGCGEDDLYAVLESMGFRRQKTDVELEKEVSDGQEITVDKDVVVEETSSLDDDTVEKSVEKKELATFFVKKGKISDRPKVKANKKHTKTPQNAKKGAGRPQKRDKNAAKIFESKPKKSQVEDDSPFAILKQLQK